MLISHRKKFIYTKTLKTGGTSVESYFERYCMPEGEWGFSHGRQEYINKTGIIGCRGVNYSSSYWKNHLSAYEIKTRVEEKVWKEYFKFCVIRNPYDKLISAFFHFDVFRNNITGTKKELITRFRSNIKNGKGLINDRDKYVIDNKLCIDGYIKTENMLCDLARICKILNVLYNPDELPKLKSNFRPGGIVLQEFFDMKTDEIVRTFYAFEFEVFGYPYLFE